MHKKPENNSYNRGERIIFTGAGLMIISMGVMLGQMDGLIYYYPGSEVCPLALLAVGALTFSYGIYKITRPR